MFFSVGWPLQSKTPTQTTSWARVSEKQKAGRLKQLRLPKPTIVTYIQYTHYTLNITPKFMSNSDEKAGKVCCPTVQSIVHARIDRRSKTPRLDTNDFWGLGPSWNCIPEQLQSIIIFCEASYTKNILISIV